MDKSDRIFIPKPRGRLPYKYREHSHGDRWIAMWLLIGATLWGLAIWWWLK